MIRLHECDRIPASSRNDALFFASNYTGFNKEDFKCEVIKEPKRVGLFKKEDGIYLKSRINYTYVSRCLAQRVQ